MQGCRYVCVFADLSSSVMIISTLYACDIMHNLIINCIFFNTKQSVSQPQNMFFGQKIQKHKNVSKCIQIDMKLTIKIVVY